MSEHGKPPIITFQPSFWCDGALARESIQAGVWLEERSFHHQKTAPQTQCALARGVCPSSVSKAGRQRLGSRVKTLSQLNNLGFDPIQRPPFAISQAGLCLLLCWGGQPASFSSVLPFGVTE